MIKLECKHCEEALEAPESMVGEFITCPGCGRPVAVRRSYADTLRASKHLGGKRGGRNLAVKTATVLVVASVLGLVVLAFFSDNLESYSGNVLGIVLSVGFVVAVAAALVAIADAPGLIATRRGHKNIEAIRVCGWLGLFLFPPLWVVAVVWAYTKSS